MSSDERTSFAPPPRNRKLVPCNCRACNEKLVDPRTRDAHAKRSIAPPQREIKESSYVNLTSSLGDLMDISDDIPREPQVSREESYSFLVRKMPVTSQTKRKSKISIPEVIIELFSDDGGDNTSEEDNESAFEDDVLEYSSNDS